MGYGTTMNVDELMARCAALLPDGERPIAATKARPRGSMHEVTRGGAGAVAGAGVGRAPPSPLTPHPTEGV